MNSHLKRDLCKKSHSKSCLMTYSCIKIVITYVRFRILIKTAVQIENVAHYLKYNSPRQAIDSCTVTLKLESESVRHGRRWMKRVKYHVLQRSTMGNGEENIGYNQLLG